MEQVKTFSIRIYEPSYPGTSESLKIGLEKLDQEVNEWLSKNEDQIEVISRETNMVMSSNNAYMVVTRTFYFTNRQTGRLRC